MDFETGYIKYEDSAMGKMERTYKEQAGQHLAELQKLREEFDQYRADNAAYQAAQEKSQKLAEKRQFWYGILSNIISAIIGGLVVYYWPAIIAFFTNFFQK